MAGPRALPLLFCIAQQALPLGFAGQLRAVACRWHSARCPRVQLQRVGGAGRKSSCPSSAPSSTSSLPGRTACCRLSHAKRGDGDGRRQPRRLSQRANGGGGPCVRGAFWQRGEAHHMGLCGSGHAGDIPAGGQRLATHLGGPLELCQRGAVQPAGGCQVPGRMASCCGGAAVAAVLQWFVWRLAGPCWGMLVCLRRLPDSDPALQICLLPARLLRAFPSCCCCTPPLHVDLSNGALHTDVLIQGGAVYDVSGAGGGGSHIGTSYGSGAPAPGPVLHATSRCAAAADDARQVGV